MAIKRNFVYFVNGNSQPPIPNSKQDYLVMFEDKPGQLFSINSKGILTPTNSDSDNNNGDTPTSSSIIQKTEVDITATELQDLADNGTMFTLINGVTDKITIVKNIVIENISSSSNFSLNTKLNGGSKNINLTNEFDEIEPSDITFKQFYDNINSFNDSERFGTNLELSANADHMTPSYANIKLVIRYIQVTKNELLNLPNLN